MCCPQRMRLSLCQLDKLVIVAVRREQEDVDVDGGFLQEESQCRFDFQYLLVKISVISSFRIDTGGVDLFRTLVILALNVRLREKRKPKTSVTASFLSRRKSW